MRITWADGLPSNISVKTEEDVLNQIELLATGAGFEVVREPELEHEIRAHSDLVLRTPSGLLIFEVRRKSNNLRARIDVETRPDATYRTRHMLLEKDEDRPWTLLNDSELPEKNPLESVDTFREMVNRLFAVR